MSVRCTVSHIMQQYESNFCLNKEYLTFSFHLKEHAYLSQYKVSQYKVVYCRHQIKHKLLQHSLSHNAMMFLLDKDKNLNVNTFQVCQYSGIQQGPTSPFSARDINTQRADAVLVFITHLLISAMVSYHVAQTSL